MLVYRIKMSLPGDRDVPIKKAVLVVADDLPSALQVFMKRYSLLKPDRIVSIKQLGGARDWKILIQEPEDDRVEGLRGGAAPGGPAEGPADAPG